jgi:aminopeptidase N
MKQHLIVLLALLLPLHAFPQTDLNVTQYDLSISNINFTGKSLKGIGRISYTTNGAPLNQIQLGLLSLTIDSITDASGQSLTYSYNDTTIFITPSFPVTNNDTATVIIYYNGSPKKDPSGWGGFYFTSTFAFNLGVGFETDPHVFGRAWFPANDVFTDRAKFDFHITTDSGYKAFCNGLLTSALPAGGNKTQWNWSFHQEIPTYLASIAVAPYVTWSRNYQNIPVEIAVQANDTNNVNATFTHLDSVLYHFIQAYGSYKYDKVGYCLVPFSSGAMEHASSIHIGRGFINGTLDYESLWIHELAHMWWGDWVTCESAGDMWLNEGFASFNEGYLTEKLYGMDAYKNWFASSHASVLQFSHVTDNGYLPLVNIPHQHTYGPTVYSKGAGVAHTLRKYMGDSAFFAGCKQYMQANGNGNANSFDLRDQLQNGSGLNLIRFFDDWVFTPGFPHFSIDSVVYVPGGLDHYFVYTKQKSKGNNHIYEMPVQITLRNETSDTTFTVVIDSLTNVFHIATVGVYNWFTVDKEDLMADAITADEKWIKTTGNTPFQRTNVAVNTINPGIDSSLIRIEHHWVAPDPFKQSSGGIRLSNYHYWSIDGFINQNYHAKGTFTYNGTNSTSVGHIDNTLITGTEDSLLLLYRRNASDDWTPVTAITQNAGNKFDKQGNFVVDTLKAGEYTLGYRDYTTGLNDPILKTPDLQIWPNPGNGEVNICLKYSGRNNAFQMNIYDLQGRYLFHKKLEPGITEKWSPKEKSSGGTYIISIISEEKEILSQKFQIF